MASMAEETVAPTQDSAVVDEFDLDAFFLSDFPFFDIDVDLLPEVSISESDVSPIISHPHESPSPVQSDGRDPPQPVPASPDSVSSFASYIEKFLMEDVDWSGAEEGLAEDATEDFFSGINLSNLPIYDALTKEGQTEEEKKARAVADEDDDDDLANKKRRRQLRNRESALKSRERKKMYISDLELKSSHLSSECHRLEHALRCCMEENMGLRQRLKMNRPCISAMAKQESAVLFVESLLLGSLFWLMSFACLFLAPGLRIRSGASKLVRDLVMVASTSLVKLARDLKLAVFRTRRRWRGEGGRMNFLMFSAFVLA